MAAVSGCEAGGLGGVNRLNLTGFEEGHFEILGSHPQYLTYNRRQTIV